ncbi:hypothetical protein ccbrp13_49770 [Ktedonobacteria bacterium brp13]|nr:hypothetical protein ccbrp13_49770 [Ktedonobacteria bacterium brp13]
MIDVTAKIKPLEYTSSAIANIYLTNDTAKSKPTLAYKCAKRRIMILCGDPIVNL